MKEFENYQKYPSSNKQEQQYDNHTCAYCSNGVKCTKLATTCNSPGINGKWYCSEHAQIARQNGG